MDIYSNFFTKKESQETQLQLTARASGNGAKQLQHGAIQFSCAEKASMTWHISGIFQNSKYTVWVWLNIGTFGYPV